MCRIGQVTNHIIEGNNLSFVVIPSHYKLEFKMEYFSLLEAENGPEALLEYFRSLGEDRLRPLRVNFPKIFKDHIDYFQRANKDKR